MYMYNVGRTIKQLVDKAGLTCFRYSGRCMYGGNCLAISVSHAEDIYMVIGQLIYAADGNKDDLDDLADALQNAKHDSLGLGAVLYFPRVEFPKEEEEEEEEEEETTKP